MREFELGDVVRYEIVGATQTRRIATHEMADVFTELQARGMEIVLMDPNTLPPRVTSHTHA